MRQIAALAVTLALGSALVEAGADRQAGSARPITFDVRKVPLGRAAPGFRDGSLVVSPDGKRVAYAAG
jgi:hypothetical protein